MVCEGKVKLKVFQLDSGYQRFIFTRIVNAIMHYPIKLTGDSVGHSSTSLKGLHTFGALSGEIVSTICGVPEVIDRFISVKSIQSRYIAEMGDVVVGRVLDICGTRWKIDIGAYQDALIFLSNVSEPGGALRRKGRTDELNMRAIFSDGDVIVCEVQKIFNDGVTSLHTRNIEKHGKMATGFLFCTSPLLIPRTRSHFHNLKFTGIRIVTGVNGFIWVDQTRGEQNNDGLARVYNALKLLAQSNQMIYIAAIEEIVELAQSRGASASDMLKKSFPWPMNQIRE